MTIDDGGGASEDEFVTNLISKLGPGVELCSAESLQQLVTTQLDEKKLKPVQVDLVEGMKNLVIAGKILFTSSLTQPSGIRKPLLASEVEDIVSKSEISGTSLAAVCASDLSSAAVVLLKQSLENI
eukprot:CAMPEP_0176290452 /NCGR_PEP_ID=MMETSP0121_2-20121125/55029_1 /TAXON_ID=160619 /ORGANISM="Kryptoperidinium foliaceum, Strain CCMP 1326" /LENGTH=125 /DNA_ID=CAMNT_0017631241 /DNA_START=13 /DNA_END=391 /DNA_ORIENTATION=-